MAATQKTKNIYQRIAAAMAELDGAVEKGGTTSFGSTYRYVRIEDLLNNLRRVLVREGIALTHTLVVEDRTGKALHQCYRFALVNVDDPADFVEALQVGTSNDQKSQAGGTCLSYATKQFLLKSFLLAGDDEDAESEQDRTDRAAAGAGKKPPKASPKAKPAPAKPAANHEAVLITDVTDRDHEGESGRIEWSVVSLDDGTVANTQDTALRDRAKELFRSGQKVSVWTSTSKAGNAVLDRVEAAA